MASNIDEAVEEARQELLAKNLVIGAEIDPTVNEDMPCNYLRKRFNVFHQLVEGGNMFSGKEIFINKDDFTYKWMYSGIAFDGPVATVRDASVAMDGDMKTPVDPTPFRTQILGKLTEIKTASNVDWLEIKSIDETQSSGELLAVKSMTGDLAETWTIKVWFIDTTTVGWKIISKITVS